MSKTKIARAAGRYGVKYGVSVRRRIAEIESRQRKKQQCLFCNARAKRLSKGIWQCKKCGKKFAHHAYFLEKNLVKSRESQSQKQSPKKKSSK